jgi:hypothetical protein
MWNKFPDAGPWKHSERPSSRTGWIGAGGGWKGRVLLGIIAHVVMWSSWLKSSARVVFKFKACFCHLFIHLCSSCKHSSGLVFRYTTCTES